VFWTSSVFGGGSGRHLRAGRLEVQAGAETTFRSHLVPALRLVPCSAQAWNAPALPPGRRPLLPLSARAINPTSDETDIFAEFWAAPGGRETPADLNAFTFLGLGGPGRPGNPCSGSQVAATQDPTARPMIFGPNYGSENVKDTLTTHLDSECTHCLGQAPDPAGVQDPKVR